MAVAFLLLLPPNSYKLYLSGVKLYYHQMEPYLHLQNRKMMPFMVDRDLQPA